MNFLARMVSPGKWGSISFGVDAADYSADALGSCLRSQGNTLSFWETAGDPVDVTETALALAAARDDVDKLCVLVLPIDALEAAGYRFSRTRGNTPVSDLRDRHRDMVDLTGHRIAALGRIVAAGVREGSNVHVFTRAEVRALLRQAWERGRIQPDSLSAKLRAAAGLGV